jgi:DNA-binding transcriptional ArsR family regulator
LSSFITHSMLETLITSKTRLKLLLKFFMNKDSASYLRNLEQEFGESSNAIRIELNRFETAGLLRSYKDGNKKYFKAETKHPLFSDIQNIIRKYIGLDTIIERVIKKLGGLESVFVSGDLAKGLESDVINLIFIGNDIDRAYLNQLVEKAESLINRKVSFIIYKSGEQENLMKNGSQEKIFLLWENK